MTSDNDFDPNKQTVMGHVRLLPKILFFSMAAYGFVKILVWLTAKMGWNV